MYCNDYHLLCYIDGLFETCRVRHGYAHVANNYYQGWTQYAIGGSMSPRVKSESNYFVAPKSGRKEVRIKPQSQT